MKTAAAKYYRESGLGLGPLEWTIMEVMWTIPEANVRDVMRKLPEPLAYTTVMTTLARLYQKRMLLRRKQDRAFIYFPAVSRQEWEQKRAGDLLTLILSGPRPAAEVIINCLVEALGVQNTELLDELEHKIQSKRRELSGETA